MGIARYIRLAPETFKMIAGKPLVFYYEEDFIGELVKRVCENYGVALRLVRRPIGELPARSEAVRIAREAGPKGLRGAAGPREKGIGHLKGMVFGDDRTEYENNLSVWLSKIGLLYEVFEDGTVPYGNIAWMDLGISKFNFIRKNWDFTGFSGKSERRVLHFSSNMRYLGEQLPLNASFLQAPGRLWPEINGLMENALEGAMGDHYPHDEETILAGIIRENPNLFRCIGGGYEGRVGKLRYAYERIRHRGVRRF